MTMNNEIRTGLLAANGIVTEGIPEEDRQALRRILKRDRSRVRRVKWTAIVAWGLVMAFVPATWILMAVLGREALEAPPLQTVLIIGWFVAFPVAVICTISLVARGLLLVFRERRVWMIETEARLAGIEDSLKQLVDRKADNKTE